jgi:hypothetical protein
MRASEDVARARSAAKARVLVSVRRRARIEPSGTP